MRSFPFRLTASRLVKDHADIILSFPAQASLVDRRRARLVLDDTELARAARFARDCHRELFIFSHGFLRLTLARYLDADARELRFSRLPGGRPELASTGRLPIRFNLSHTKGLIACVVTRSAECGIDVEYAERTDYRNLVATVLAPSEFEEFMALDEELRQDRFLEIWTLKEAYLKGRGFGLLSPLRSVAFSGFDGQRVCTVDLDSDDNGRAWRFWSSKPTSQHHAAAALRTEGCAATFFITIADVLP